MLSRCVTVRDFIKVSGRRYLCGFRACDLHNSVENIRSVPPDNENKVIVYSSFKPECKVNTKA